MHSVLRTGKGRPTNAHPVTETPLAEAIGLALGQAHWDLSVDPDNADVVDHTAGHRETCETGNFGLPVTDIDLHVTGEKGAPPNVLGGLLALLRRIGDGGRARPTPVEQDYVTGYLRQLARDFPSVADRELLRALLSRAAEHSLAGRTALDNAWTALNKT
jgi:hypothetical protein